MFKRSLILAALVLPTAALAQYDEPIYSDSNASRLLQLEAERNAILSEQTRILQDMESDRKWSEMKARHERERALSREDPRGRGKIKVNADGFYVLDND